MPPARQQGVPRAADPAHPKGLQAGKKFQPPNPPLQEQKPRSPSEPGSKNHDASLEKASLLANEGRHDEAIAVCGLLVRRQGPSAAAYYLMGMINQAAGREGRAEECFHKAVYLDPDHDEALLALALVAERRGDASMAAGFRRRAQRAELRARKGVP
jgi:chemotaxis protein methyltransferase WspC